MSSQNRVAKLGPLFTNAKPYLLMIGLQFGMAGNYIFGKVILDHGISRFVFIVYRNAMAATALAPFAFIIERKNRPKMALAVFLQIMILGFLELECVKFRVVRRQAKVIGTLVTFGGAVVMALYKGPGFNLFHSGAAQNNDVGPTLHRHQTAGALYILMGCVALSSFYILQTIRIDKYPAELSLATWICMAGTVQTTAVAPVAECHSGFRAWAIGWDLRLYAALYTFSNCILSSRVVMKMRGPIFTKAFNPLCMIIVAAFGFLLLGERIYLGSIIGSIIIPLGLYLAVWGKAKDYTNNAKLPSAAAEETKSLPITAKDPKMEIVVNVEDQPSSEHQLEEPNFVRKDIEQNIS